LVFAGRGSVKSQLLEQPGKAFNITQARVRFGNQEQVIPVRKSNQEVTFKFQLPEGKADLQTWFQTADGDEFGAHYVYIDKLRE
jgi:hypothetical protein